MHFLQFSWGTTRFVALVGMVAIKIARPRPIWVLRRLIEYWVTGVASKRLLVYADNPLESGFRHLLAGVAANQREYRLWQESRHHFLMPTLYSFYGLINVQERGERITERELITLHPFRLMIDEEVPIDAIGDMTKAANFCHYEGRVCLLDYGSDTVFTFFSRPQSRATALTPTYF